MIHRGMANPRFKLIMTTVDGSFQVFGGNAWAVFKSLDLQHSGEQSCGCFFLFFLWIEGDSKAKNWHAVGGVSESQDWVIRGKI